MSIGVGDGIEAHGNAGFGQPVEKIFGDGDSSISIGRPLIELGNLKFMSKAVYFCLERGNGLSGSFHRLL
jgi:hypothetical protein